MRRTQPSEEAMKNLYSFLGRILPKYVSEINQITEERERQNLNDRSRNKTA
ncbi:hypothetical protein DET56_109223 [Paenibacillus pabuli]|uniref:Uncharacterized protein n=1 Tax=Paenibacillus pabuli TaxID=1472 RepID=A0A855XR83_9BACL|nr:hypothetical protein DET56_109223 [Paenibacillus pabuli]PXW05479.1 hypothetical protein DEU73_108222 [Paenibacillus taichungensis]